VTLQVPGPTHRAFITFPEVVADYDCVRFLAAMLGDDANWARNVRTAEGGWHYGVARVRAHSSCVAIRVIMQVRPALSYAIWSTEATTGRFIPQRSHTPTSRRPTRHDHHGQPVPESGERGRKGFIGPSIRSDSAAMPLVPPTRCGH